LEIADTLFRLQLDDEMKRNDLRARRRSVGVTLLTIAADAKCSLGTARCFELGLDVRHDLAKRLGDTYRRLVENVLMTEGAG